MILYTLSLYSVHSSFSFLLALAFVVLPLLVERKKKNIDKENTASLLSSPPVLSRECGTSSEVELVDMSLGSILRTSLLVVKDEGWGEGGIGLSHHTLVTSSLSKLMLLFCRHGLVELLRGVDRVRDRQRMGNSLVW
jgi:hypothetical protein